MTRIAGRQISDDGLASIGDVLTWDGTKWYPAPSAGGVTPPLSPADNGKFARALSGDLVYVTVTQVTADLNLFTDTLQGVVPASGGGSVNFLRADGVWAAPGGGVTPPVGGTGEVAYASGSDLAYASDVKIAGTGTALAFGTTPALTGLLRVPHASTLVAGRNQPNNADVNLLQWGNTGNNRLTIGSTGVSDTYFNISTGSGYNFQVNGTVEYTFDSTSVQLNSNNLVSAGFLSFTGSGPTSGLVRVPHASSVVVGRNAANSADALLLTWGTAANNRITLGDANVAEQYQNVATGGTYNLQVNSSTEYTFDATQLTWNGNNSVGAGFYSGTGTVAGSGLLRGANNTVLVAARNAAGTADIAALAVDGSNVVVIGGAGTPNAVRVYANATTNFTVAINGTDEYNLTATQLTMNNNNLVGAGFLSSTGTPATAGFVRVAHGTIGSAGRNNANTADATVWSWGVAATDTLVFGDTNVANTTFNIATGGTYTLQINSSVEYTFDANQFNLNSNALVGLTAIGFTGTIATAGLIRVAHGSNIIEGRNQGNTADSVLMAWGTGANNRLTLGDTVTAEQYFNVATSGTFNLQVNGTTEYTLNSTGITMNANNIVGAGFVSQTGTASATGVFRTASAQAILTSRNNANTADIGIITTDASDQVTIGDAGNTASLLFGVKSAGSISLFVAGGLEYAFNSTRADWGANNIVNIGFASFGTTPATNALLRSPSNQIILSALNAAGTGNIQIIATDASDNVYVGGSNSLAASLSYNVKTGGTHILQVNNAAEYSFSSTIADFKDNSLQFGTNPAASGLVRTPNNTAIISARNAANTADVEALRVDGSNVVVIGGAGTPNAVRVYANATTNFTVAINGTDEYNLTATQLTMNNNNLVMGTGIISSGSNVASTGSVRGGYGLSIYSRNNLNSGDFNVIQSAQVFGVDNSVLVGDTTAAKVESWTGSGGSYVWRINGTVELQLDANKLFVANSGTPPTTDPSGGGYFYADSGAGKWRGSSGTVTTFGPAEPHCPRCGSDFVVQYSNPKKYGDFSGCMLCLNKALQRLGISEDEWVIEHKEAA